MLLARKLKKKGLNSQPQKPNQPFEEFDFHNQPVDKTAQEIKKRVNQVVAAFEEKHAEINETYEFEI